MSFYYMIYRTVLVTTRAAFVTLEISNIYSNPRTHTYKQREYFKTRQSIFQYEYMRMYLCAMLSHNCMCEIFLASQIVVLFAFERKTQNQQNY